MTTTDTASRIVRFTATARRDCASPWTCTGVQPGTRAGYVGAYGPRPVCEPCAERIEVGEAGETPTVEPLCTCTSRTGFTGRPDGVFVCASCGRLAALPETTAATHRTVDVVEPAQPDAPVEAPEVGDVSRITKIAILEDASTGGADRSSGEPVPSDTSTSTETARGEVTATPEPPRDDPNARPLRILVTGSRHLGNSEHGRDHEADRQLVRTALREAAGVALDVVLVHGAAPGADTGAAEIARAFGWTVEEHPADWEAAGKAAGPQRNARMVALGADRCVAFPLGESRGTRDCMAKAVAAGIPLTVVDVPPTPQPAEPATPAEPITPQQRGRAEVEAWVRGEPEPTERQAIEELSRRVEAVDTLAGEGLVTPYIAAHAAPPADRAQAVALPTTNEVAQIQGITPDMVNQFDGYNRPLTAEAHAAHPNGYGNEPMPLPDLTPWMPEATRWGSGADQAAADLIDAVRHGILAGDLRGRQVEIGPSEVGHECARWLAYRLAGVPPTGQEPVPWRQRVGTLVHNDFDDHAHRDNVEREAAGLGVRWLTGIRVDVGELYPGRPIVGTLDVLDVVTATVLDAKVPGSTAMKTYGRGKPERPSYRTQVQLYGRGVMRAGFLPAHVGVLRVSPARELSEYIVKTEPFNARVGEEALARAGGIARMVDQLGDRAPALLPPTEATCHRCPWLRPGTHDLARGCPGAPGADLSRTSARASVDDLVA